METVLDIPKPIETDNENYINKVKGNVELTKMVIYTVKLEGCPVKIDWSHELFTSAYSVGIKRRIIKRFF
jgi:hypothetical protein